VPQVGLAATLELDDEVEPPGDGNQFRDLA